MKSIHIIGNSGAARECYWIIRELLECDSDFRNRYNFAGFFAWKNYPGNLGELSCMQEEDVSSYCISADDVFVIGIGNPKLRQEVFVIMKERGANFMNLIHPLADICPSAFIGEGNIFQRYCSVYANAVCGNGNYFNGHVNISHDAAIGDYNFFAPYSIVLGNSVVGDLNHLGPHAVLLDKAKIGNKNNVAPGSVVYKGCKDNCRLVGNPAFCV